MEDKPEKKRKKVMRRLRYKFRMLIINDDTFEEHFSLKLSLLNIITVLGVLMFVVAGFVVVILTLTPLREYIPGYADVQTKNQAVYAVMKTDSLAVEIERREKYLDNLKLILSGQIGSDSIQDVPLEDIRVDQIYDQKSAEDSAMRVQIEEQEKYALQNNQATKENMYFFFAPIRGTVVSHFDTKTDHLGVDIVTKENASIQAAMDGTIIMADYTTKSGFVLQIQHRNNLVTTYKHCSVVLKKHGEKVSAGDPIALVGNTGELTSGPHLHFEIWENGIPIDPEKYIIF